MVVMMPDVEAYAPLVDAVFGGTGAGPGRVPYRIADRTRRSGSAVTEAFLSILAFAGGRARASEVLDLLQLQPVRARFGIRAAGSFHWSRAGCTTPACAGRWMQTTACAPANPPTTRTPGASGSKRLLLGYAMPGSGVFEDVLPFDDMEGSEVELVGQLAELAERLFAWRKRLAEPRTPAGWQGALGLLLDEMITVPRSRRLAAAARARRTGGARRHVCRGRFRGTRRARCRAYAARAGVRTGAHDARFPGRRRDVLRDAADAQYSVPGRVPDRDERW